MKQLLHAEAECQTDGAKDVRKNAKAGRKAREAQGLAEEDLVSLRGRVASPTNSPRRLRAVWPAMNAAFASSSSRISFSRPPILSGVANMLAGFAVM
jgi:hypothetical protein